MRILGAWGYGINENDTSFDVRETFFEKYNSGMEPDAIYKDIYKQFDYSLNDNEDCDNVLFSLAYCLWETCSLPDDLLAKVRRNIEQESNIEVWRALDANEDLIKKRITTLNKFVAKISTPKDKPKARKKPPVKIGSTYQAGSCLTFKYPDGNYGGVLVIGADFFNTKGSIYIVLTSIRSKEPPLFEDFERAKLMDFEWEMVYGQSARYAAIKRNDELYTGRIHQHSMNYDNRKSFAPFMDALQRNFQIAGQFSKLTQILCSTTWIDKIDDAPDILDYYYNLADRPISEMTLLDLTDLLTVRAI